MSDYELSKSDWKRVKEIFILLIDSKPNQITSQLESLSEGNENIINAVKDMLEMHNNENEQTITPSLSAAETLTSFDHLQTGDAFGKYVIKDTIASGGMGRVYLAERNDDILQQVAIKVLPQHQLDQQTIARFDIERRILATLEHPNIARLIDAGTENNQAFFVMEYVDGQSIDDYCQSKHLSLKQRINLFLKVCDAVSYAHNHLIVHRDLKPSNIMVSAFGEVKLLDFGIAKPLKTIPGTDQVHETIVGRNTLTPQYAAPEQIKGEAITVGCDIYVLGLLLYRILTDQHAYELSDKSWGEIEQVITQDLVLQSSKKVLKSDSDELSFEPKSWGKKLKGDLDAIINQALKKEVNQRFTSVKGLAEELKRYINHEPLGIKKDHQIYRLKKQARKHWMPITALVLIFSVLLVSSILIWYQSILIKIERDKALVEKQAAEQATNFLVNTFKSADPTKALGTKLTAADIMKQGLFELNQTPLDPLVKNKILSVLAEVNFNLSDYDQAQNLAKQITIADLAEYSDDRTKSVLITAKIMSKKDEKKKALELVNDLLAVTEDLGESYYSIMNLKVSLLVGLNEYNEAINLSKSLLNNAKQQKGELSLEYAIQLREHGNSIRNAENREEVHNLMMQALAILEQISHSKQLINYIKTKEVLVKEKISLQRYDEAILMLNGLKQDYEKIYEPNHMAFVRIYSSLANIYLNQKQAYESLENYKTSLSISKQHLGDHSTRVAMLEINIGVVYLYEIKDFVNSRKYLESGLNKIKQISGKNNNFNYMSLVYATCLIKQEFNQEALDIIEDVISYYESKGMEKSRAHALAFSLKAHLLTKENKYLEAESYYILSKDKVLQHYGDTLHGEMIESDLEVIKGNLQQN